MATTVTLKPNAIDISGSTSGTTTLQATAVAGTTTLTLPAATDTLVGKATTDTLTNKTLTSPTITGGALNGTVGATTPSTGAFTTISTTGDVTVGSAGGTRTLTIGNTSSTGAGFINLVTSSSFKNWQIASNQYVASTLSFTPSTATGGTTFTTPSLNILDIGLSTGNIGIGGTTPTSSGAGITFPATQSASSDANTLDDYEEGTWTPSIGGTATYTTQVGHYTKIGKQVTLIFDLAILLLGTGSTTTITGAPFAPAANIGNYHTGSVFWETIASSQISVGTFIQQSTSQIFFYTRSTAGTSVVNASAIIGSGTILRGTLTYFV